MKALVPLDGSENSHRIFLTVRRLLAMQPAIEVHLVTVHDPHATRGRTDHAVSHAPSTRDASARVTDTSVAIVWPVVRLRRVVDRYAHGPVVGQAIFVGSTE